VVGGSLGSWQPAERALCELTRLCRPAHTAYRVADDPRTCNSQVRRANGTCDTAPSARDHGPVTLIGSARAARWPAHIGCNRLFELGVFLTKAAAARGVYPPCCSALLAEQAFHAGLKGGAPRRWCPRGGVGMQGQRRSLGSAAPPSGATQKHGRRLSFKVSSRRGQSPLALREVGRRRRGHQVCGKPSGAGRRRRC
jgi:hypothetical protein